MCVPSVYLVSPRDLCVVSGAPLHLEEGQVAEEAGDHPRHDLLLRGLALGGWWSLGGGDWVMVRKSGKEEVKGRESPWPPGG